MRITPDTVDRERRAAIAAADRIVPLINAVRADLADQFDVPVDSVSNPAYRETVATVFADGDRAANVAALAAILRDLDVPDDYPGFVIDDLLGRELAATIAGDQPLRLLAESTFHYADVQHDADDTSAGVDDWEAALAAGVQTRVPGWPWREATGPFDDA